MAYFGDNIIGPSSAPKSTIYTATNSYILEDKSKSFGGQLYPFQVSLLTGKCMCYLPTTLTNVEGITFAPGVSLNIPGNLTVGANSVLQNVTAAGISATSADISHTLSILNTAKISFPHEQNTPAVIKGRVWDNFMMLIQCPYNLSTERGLWIESAQKFRMTFEGSTGSSTQKVFGYELSLDGAADSGDIVLRPNATELQNGLNFWIGLDGQRVHDIFSKNITSTNGMITHGTVTN